MNDHPRTPLRNVIPLVLLSVLLAVSCNRQPTRWEVDVAVPVVDQVWTWSEVVQNAIEGDEVVWESGTPGVLRYSGPISEWNIASLTQLPDTLVEQVLTPEFTGGPFPVPPGAVLLDTEEDIVFQGIDQAFTEIVLESGTIEYLVESSTDGYVDLQYLFPSVTILGVPVELKVLLPPSNGVDFQTASGTIDLAGARIDLTGVSGNEINRIASQLIIGTPADIADTAQVYGSDSIRVQMHFQSLFVQEVAGYFGQEVVDFDVEQPMFSPVDFPAGFIEINPTRAMLAFHNTLAADLRLQLDAMTIDGMHVGHPALGQPQLIGRAEWNGADWVPAVWEMDLLETQPALFELLSYLPEAVAVNGSGLLNPLGDVSGGHDYFDTRNPPALYLDFEWPLAGAIEGFTVARSVEFGGADFAGFEGELIVRLNNGFPVKWALDGAWDYADESLEPAPIEALIPAFSDGASVEIRIPMDEQRLQSPATLTLRAAMQSEGPVEFSGHERFRVHVAFEGTYQVEVP